MCRRRQANFSVRANEAWRRHPISVKGMKPEGCQELAVASLIHAGEAIVPAQAILIEECP